MLVLLSNANIGNSKNEIIKLFKSITYFSLIAIKHLDLYTLRFKSANFDWAAHRLFSRITNSESRFQNNDFFVKTLKTTNLIGLKIQDSELELEIRENMWWAYQF